MEFILNPAEIEAKSFEIIDGLLAGKEIECAHRSVIKRVIHTTADVEYAESLAFSEGAIDAALNALKNGAHIITDTQMAKAGINKKAVSALKCRVSCFIDSDEVAALAEKNGVTRAQMAVEYAAERFDGAVFAVGNAPTALLKLHELINGGRLKPVLIIGVPVGFVNVTESKELIMKLNTHYIVSRGRKGGSNVAAAIVNALLYEAAK